MIIVAVLFICSFLFTPLFLLLLLLIIFTASSAMMIGSWRMHIMFLAAICLSAMLLYGLSMFVFGGTLSGYASLLIMTIVGVVVAAIYAFRKNIAAMFLTLGIFIISVAFVPTADTIFESVLKEHQKVRILSFLGIMSDPSGADYNVNQSKIAIGSGGILGKGYLNGTQTKLSYVPEQDTDFVFCTIGEERGFIGSVLFIAVYAFFMIRLIYLAERQRSAFSRIYGYGLVSIFLFHFFINLGMITGITPVIGIPLPFISYGGSSLWGFTIMLFTFIRLDANRMEVLQHS
jgi:rod shape determining protein RodA